MPKRKVSPTYTSRPRVLRAVKYRTMGLTKYETAKIMETSPNQVTRLLKIFDEGRLLTFHRRKNKRIKV